MNHDEVVLREFEIEVLDRHYATLPLWREEARRRVWGLLVAYDSFVYPHYLVQNHPKSHYAIQQFKGIHESLTIALRWHCSDSPNAFPSPDADSDLIDCAGDFLLFAGNHFRLSNMHSMYGHGLVDVECNKPNRLVRFVPGAGGEIPSWHAVAEGAISEAVERTARADVVATLGKAALDLDYFLSEGRIVLRNPEQLLSMRLLDNADKLVAREPLPLADDTMIDGFSMRTFRKFWRALEVWSFCTAQIYLNLIIAGLDQAQCMPTQILSFERFVETMTELAGATVSEVTAIINLLTFDSSNKKADVILQPFLRARDTIAWPVLAVQLSKPERNLLKLMSRTPRLRARAAVLIGGREKELVANVGRFLAKRAGFQFKLNKTITVGGEQAEVDLLAYSTRARDELLLIEAKAILGTDDVNEQIEGGRVLSRAGQQLDRCAQVLQNAGDDYLALAFPFVDWPRIRSVHRLIVTPDTAPSSSFAGNSAAAVSFVTMQHAFRNRDLQTPSRICAAARERPRVVSPSVVRIEYEALIVGDVTYELPVALFDEDTIVDSQLA